MALPRNLGEAGRSNGIKQPLQSKPQNNPNTKEKSEQSSPQSQQRLSQEQREVSPAPQTRSNAPKSEQKRQYTPEQVEQIKRERLRRKKAAEQKAEKIAIQEEGNRRKPVAQKSSSNKNTSSTHENNRSIPQKQNNESKTEARSIQEKKENTNLPEGYAIDPATGVKYKKLPTADSGLVKEFKKSKGKMDITLSMLRDSVPEADFDLNDLNGAADDFLGHLRVAPDKEEIARLREERKERMRQQNKQYEENEEKLNEKYGSLEPDPDDVWNG